jgi:cellulose synthase/poly-beta-1,6-N-acetylglucosamine synthase-like glycosyltransferase
MTLPGAFAELARTVLRYTGDGIVLYFLLLNSITALLLILAIRELWSHWHVADDDNLGMVLSFDALPPLSIIVTEEDGGAATADQLHSCLTQRYPRHEVLLVSDGIANALMRDLELHQVPPAVMVSISTAPVRGYYHSRRFSKLLVIDKPEAGRADALNAAVNAARYPYVLSVEAGTLLEPDALVRMARPFLIGKSAAIVGSTVRVAEVARIEEGQIIDVRAPTRWLSGVQAVESLRAFVYSRLGWNRLRGNVLVNGALGLVLRDHVLAVGGYRTAAADQDSDLALRVRRYLRDHDLPDEVVFIPEPVAWAVPPTTVAGLGRQRDRWHRGVIELLVANRDLFFNPRYGTIGFLALPHLVIGELFAPIVEMAGYLGVLIVLAFRGAGGDFLWSLILVVLGYATLLSFWAILLERIGSRRSAGVRHLVLLSVWALVEPLGYRQMTLWFRLRAAWRFVRGEHSWTARPQDVEVERRDPVSETV